MNKLIGVYEKLEAYANKVPNKGDYLMYLNNCSEIYDKYGEILVLADNKDVNSEVADKLIDKAIERINEIVD